MGNQSERTRDKAVDCAGEVALADRESKDSKPLAVKYCGGCDGGRESQSHRRVHWKVGLEWEVTKSGTRSEQVALFPL